MNRRFAQVALAAAAAMTFSLASPVTAQASEAAPAKRGTDSTTLPAPKAAPSAATGSVRFTTSAVLNSYSKNTNARTRLAVSAPGIERISVYADVFVNGRAAKRNEFVGSNTYTTGAVYWPRAAGYGKVQLRNVRAEYYDANYDKRVEALPDSNVVAIRRGVWGKEGVSIVKRGSKVTMQAKKWRVVQPNGKSVAVRKLVVKRAVKGKWRKVKVIKLNKKGNGKITFKAKKKFKYRVYLNTTATVQGTYYYWPGKY